MTVQMRKTLEKLEKEAREYARMKRDDAASYRERGDGAGAAYWVDRLADLSDEHADELATLLREPNAPVAPDARRFLQMLLGPCDGTDAHAWRKCKRCLALYQLENRDRLAVSLIEQAIADLEAQP